MVKISNLHYANEANTIINMDVVMEGRAPFPFSYTATDSAPVSVAVRALLQSGDYPIAPYRPDGPSVG